MSLKFEKYADGLMPAVVQDAETLKVLMVGFMNEEAFAKTNDTGKVTFYSRSQKKLWTKGETSGNFLNVVEVLTDCDDDTVLVKARPVGPTCHTGSDTCFDESNSAGADFLSYLERVIQNRKKSPVDGSYTNRLFEKGINKIAQKVGEEAVELVIESKDDNKDLFLGEAADLLYHLLVLLAQKEYTLSEVIAVLESRHK